MSPRLPHRNRRTKEGSALVAALVLLGLMVAFSVLSAVTLAHFQRNLGLFEERHNQRWSGRNPEKAELVAPAEDGTVDKPARSSDE